MALQLMQRRSNHSNPTPDEAAIGVLREQLEPQVRDAVFEFNRKGSKTTSSVFNGTDVEHQTIAGHFLLDDETKQQLAAIGVTVTTEPWWKWVQKERMGIADPNTPAEERMLTTVAFRCTQPDLQAMEIRWKQIAAVLPDRKQASQEDAL